MNEENMYDKLFDTVLREALKEVVSESAPNPPKEILTGFSAEHTAKMQKIFNTEKRKIRKRKLFRHLRCAAAGFAALVVVSSITVCSVSALRIRFLNFITNTEPTSTEFTVTEDSRSGTYNSDKLSVEYIPAGFTLIGQKQADDFVFVQFSDTENAFEIMLYPAKGSTSIDTENADCEKIAINDMTAMYYEKENEHNLVMQTDENLIIINSTIPKEEIVKIAQGLKIK